MIHHNSTNRTSGVKLAAIAPQQLKGMFRNMLSNVSDKIQNREVQLMGGFAVLTLKGSLIA